MAQNSSIYYLTVSLGHGRWQDSVASALLGQGAMVSCWLLAESCPQCLRHVSLHEAAFNMAVYFARGTTETAREKVDVHSFITQSRKEHSIPFAVSKTLGPLHTRGEWQHKTMNTPRWGSLKVIREAAYTCFKIHNTHTHTVGWDKVII